MKRNKLLIILTVVVFAAAAVYFLLFNDKPIEVSAMKSYKGSITKTIEVSGTINSSDVEVIYLEQGKDVVKTYVMENDSVEKNQLLAELDASELYITLEKSKLDLEELNTKLDEINKENSDLILLNNNLLRSKEDYTKISEDLANAKENLAKAEVLYSENVISKAEYDNYVLAVNNLNSKIKTAELNLKDATVNYGEGQDQKLKNKLSLERQIKSVNLDIESLNNKIHDTKVYSAIAGIVTEFPIKESQKTINGDKITIHSTSSYVLKALVTQQDAVLIYEGQKSIVTVDGVSSIYEGVVEFVSKVAVTDNNGSMLPKTEIKIKILNPDDRLIFGYEGEAKIIIESKDDVLLIKNESVKKEGSNEFVYLINNNAAKKTYVETGLSDGYVINIKSGINEDDIVIVNPPINLNDGMMVKTVE